MKITPLTQTNPLLIYQAFTRAFENYVIPLEFNQERTFERWLEAGVDFNLSYGAFDEEELVAFILQVPVDKTLYNFGTGVVPSHRGQHLIEKIYHVIGEELPATERYILEVIKENTPALSLYKKMGFKIVRELISLRGDFTFITNQENGLSYDVTPIKNTTEMKQIRLASPGTEFSYPVLEKHPERHELHTLKNGSELLAYAIYTPGVMSLKELGANQRKESYLDQLFLHMKVNREKIRIMNIDSAAQDLVDYFQKRGLEIFVKQFEMEKTEPKIF